MALTQVSSLNLVQTTFEQLAYFALRPELYFASMAEVKPTNLSTRGLTVQFQLTADLPAATTPLTEITDVPVVAISDSTVQVVLQEYGNAVQTTARLRAGAYMEINPIVANVIGFNAGITLDTIARNTFQAGTNVAYSTQSGTPVSRVTVPTGDFLNGNAVRKAVAKLRGANVATFGGTYKGIIHPDVSYDFRGATGGTNWSDPHVYSDPAGIWNGYVGNFQGVTFMESPRAPLFSGAGAAGVDVYRTLVLGRQAVAMAYSNGGAYTGGANPTYVDTPVVDALRRFEGIGWKWLGGFAVFRQASLYGIESASTIAVNA